MGRQRTTIADNLSQVIEVIELGQRSGLLSIERDILAGLEEGDIYFVQGKAIYACTGAKVGRIALEMLRTWGTCRFAFLSNIPTPTPNIGPEIRDSRPFQTDSILPVAHTSHPPLNAPQRSGVRPSSVPPPPPFQRPVTVSPPTLGPHQRPKHATNPQDIPRLAARYQLSWAQRMIFLLADGEHTVTELARLSGRPEEEVLRLLAELMGLGLITLLS
jgi:Domain of unknown function (DUF4388)